MRIQKWTLVFSTGSMRCYRCPIYNYICPMSKPKVLVTFDSMKDTNCGYFSFGKGLGDAILKENHDQFDLQFYLFPVTDYFDGKVAINRRSKLHDLYFGDHN